MFNLRGQKAVNILSGCYRLASEGPRSLKTMVRWFLVCLPRTKMLAHHHYEVWQTKAGFPGACVEG